MFSFKFYLVSALLVCSGLMSLASTGTRSNYFWQPATDKFFVQGDVQVGSSSDKLVGKSTGGSLSSTSTSTTRSILNYLLSGGYGLTEQWALRTRFFTGQLVEKHDYQLGQEEGRAKYVGLGDIYIDAINTTLINPDLKIHYGLSTGMSLQNKKRSSAADNGNLYSGGMSLMPYFGVAASLDDQQLVGAKIAYDIKMSRKEENQSNNPVTTETITGKNISSLDAFYEYHSADYLVGLSFGMNSISSSIRKYELSTDGEEITAGYLQFPMSLYGTYFINNDLAVIGQYKYVSTSDHDITNETTNVSNRLTKSIENQFQVSLRYEF